MQAISTQLQANRLSGASQGINTKQENSNTNRLSLHSKTSNQAILHKTCKMRLETSQIGWPWTMCWTSSSKLPSSIHFACSLLIGWGASVLHAAWCLGTRIPNKTRMNGPCWANLTSVFFNVPRSPHFYVGSSPLAQVHVPPAVMDIG